MTKTVEFLFDFGSPNAYLSHRVIPAIEARTGARFAYVPVLLGGLFKLTGNQPPTIAFGIPTFFVGDEIYFGKDRLRDVEEEIVAQGR